MERCAYCGDKVGDDALYVDEEIFCSEECMRDFGASARDGGGDYDDDDDDEEEEGNLDEAYEEEEDY